MIGLEIQDEGTSSRAKEVFEKQVRRIKDLSPVYKLYAGYHTAQLVPQTFATKGAAMTDGKRWANYSPAYKKRKKQLGGLLGNMLVLKGDLKGVASGGSGFSKKISKDGLVMSITGFPHLRVHQSGGGNNIPARNYFHKGDYKNPDLPRRAWAFLVKATENHIMKGVK